MACDKRVFYADFLFDGAARFEQDAELYVKDGKIAGILSAKDTSERAVALRAEFKAGEHIREPFGLIMPGFINSHHHAYSAFARGMPVCGSMANFPLILKNLWWKLDLALDHESSYLSALVTAIDCIRHGTTTIIDHHASPRSTKGSLNEVQKAFNELGMTSVICFETSDRNGQKAFNEAIEENLEFGTQNRNNPVTRGMFGLHASFTLSDESLKTIAERNRENLPIHVHVAEDKTDVHHAVEQRFGGSLARLDALGALTPASLIIHGVYLNRDEFDIMRAGNHRLVHNPQSNCNNQVGYADLDKAPAGALMLGTDGMNSDMVSAAQFSYLIYKAFGGGDQDPFDLIKKSLFINPSDYLSNMFGRPIGKIALGERADFTIYNYITHTNMTSDNFMGHFIYGFPHSSKPIWVYANGQAILERGQLVTIDEKEVIATARAKSDQVWQGYLEHAKA